MRKIASLTDKQKARFPEYIERWTRSGLSTEPADRPKAEAAIVEMYRVAGLAAPRIVWCGSPLSQGLTRAVILDNKLAKPGDSVRSSVWDSVGAAELERYTDPQNPLVSYLRIRAKGDELRALATKASASIDAVLIEHERSFDTHETVALQLDGEEAVYQVVRQRQLTPEGWARAVID